MKGTTMTSTTSTTAPELLTAVRYTDRKAHVKAAMVIGTPESTSDAIPEDQVSLMIFSPLSGRAYQRFAKYSPTLGTWFNAHESDPAEVPEFDGTLDADGTEDAGPFPQDDSDDQGAE